MSKVKSPREKKRLSLTRDRRNTYGEHDKGSRKRIRRHKQSDHKAQRRAVTTAFATLKGEIDAMTADEAELVARQKLLQHQRRAFRKLPDAPLYEVIAQKLKRSKESVGAKKKRRQAFASRNGA